MNEAREFEDVGRHRVVDILWSRPELVELLTLVAGLGLPDAWIGAGLIRNAVWDAVSGGATPQPASDVDVIFFDSSEGGRERDLALETALLAIRPGLRWSVKNQSRMHERAGDPPYVDTRDAVSRWPEICTAVAARLAQDGIQVLAPHGVADLLGLVVRPTPAFEGKLDVFEARVREKAWTARWPGLTVIRSAAVRIRS